MPILYFDITKFRRQNRHRSGLNRVSVSLQKALAGQNEAEVRTVYWSTLRRSYMEAETNRRVGRGQEADAFFSPETFALKERPFCRGWLKRFHGRSGVLFHDAIPFFHPETTWPRSVRRFPYWFRDLSAYDRVLFVSKEARDHAHNVSQATSWTTVDGPVLPLGADYGDNPLPRLKLTGASPVLLNIGIIEPRKGQARLLEAAEILWKKGIAFQLVFLGRVNPHFGQKIAHRIQELKQMGRPVVHETDADDRRLAYWHQRAALVVLPTRAEGYGLPAVESLWAGCPVLATNHPSLYALGEPSGVRILETATTEDIIESLDSLLADVKVLNSVEKEIRPAELPKWSDSARNLLQELGLPVNP